MDDFLTFFNENPFLAILLVILAITFAFRLIVWIYDKLMGDRGFLGDVTNIIVWITRKLVKILIILIIVALICAALL